MKKILVLFLFMFGITASFALENFDIYMNGPIDNGNLYVKAKYYDNILNIKLYASDTELLKQGVEKGLYTFSFPKNFKINTLNKNILLKVKYKDKPEQKYIYDKFFPDFNGLELLDLTGGKQIFVNGNLTGSCKLFYDENKSWNLSYDKNKGKYYFILPKVIEKEINGGYVNCDKLSSFYRKFYIPASPKIIYAKLDSHGKLLIVGENIKLSNNDDIKVLLNGKGLKYKTITNNKLEAELPYENLNNASLQIIRNAFESNKITINLKKQIILKRVETISKQAKFYFRLYGNFDKFKLGTPEVYFNNKKLKIAYKGTLGKYDYIDVYYPEFKKTKDSFTCSYYIENGYFSVKIGGVVSNKIFYTPSLDLQIQYIEKPSCANGQCFIKVYLNRTIPNAIKFFVNNSSKDFSSIGNLAKISTNDDYIKKGDIYFVNNFCIKSSKYYFDFENEFKPYITYIESKDAFKSQAEFKIYGENLTRDNTNKDIKLSVSFNPKEVVLKYTKGFSTINGEVAFGAKNGQKVSVSISTRHGKGNGATFVVGGAKKYLGNPVIKNILYPDGGEGGEKAIIEGLAFSEKCSENKIYFAGKVVYPSECSLSKLVFTIPSDLQTDKIYIEVNGNKSNEFTLNTKIGGDIVDKKLDLYGVNEAEVVRLGKDNLSKEISFNIDNTLTDVYLYDLKFILSGVDYPVTDVIYLEINGKNNKYFLSPSQKKVLQTNERNFAQFKKIRKGYEILFKGVYIPFSTKTIKAKLKFNLTNMIPNNTKFSIILPKQKIYYKGVFQTDEKAKLLNLENSFKVLYKIINNSSKCFDSAKNNENCALVMQGKEIKNNISKKEGNKSSSTNKNSANNKITNNTKKPDVSDSNKKFSKQERIARKLNENKMKIINKILLKFIIKKKKQYWGTSKIKYVLGMYKGYKIMKANTSNNWDKKLKYVDGLLYFVKNYYALMTPGLKK